MLNCGNVESCYMYPHNICIRTDIPMHTHYIHMRMHTHTSTNTRVHTLHMHTQIHFHYKCIIIVGDAFDDIVCYDSTNGISSF